ncbi:MAG TPA: cytochrome c oxidase subunit 4 [Homoserinimonas sp.]|nr:cytochrome c oxidase subunit 4 [Homoserinimonas sp.]
MKGNVILFWALCGFFLISAVLYVIWSALFATSGIFTVSPGEDGGHVEWVGALALTLCAIMFAFLAFYIGKSYQSQGGELPEDRGDANIDDGDPELGHFSPWSWWPIVLAGAASLVLLGIAIGAWIAMIGAVLVAVALVGWVYEYYRGHFSH